MIEINRITNANIYVDGVNFIGKAEEVTTPDVKAVMQEIKGLGLVGSPKFFAGIDLEDAKIKWNSMYKDASTLLSDFTKAVPIQARTSLETYTAEGRTQEQAVVYYFTGTPTNIPGLGNLKPRENAESESNLNITYAKLVIGADVIYEVDILNNIYNVAGKDILAKYRKNLGM